MYRTVEIHLHPNADFTRRFARRVKRAGGSYRAARGHASCRFVNLPASETNLINTLCSTYGASTLVARDFAVKFTHQLPAWVVVLSIPLAKQRATLAAERLQHHVYRSLQRARERGITEEAS